jgi:phosphoribosylamine--glycine ligase
MHTVLIVGSGGREHALEWALRRSARVSKVLVAPGNGGTRENIGVGEFEFPALLEVARDRGVSLVVVGPEAPLAAGITDAFAGSGIPVFGPGQEAAKLESSKAFAKTLMRDCGVPTADFEVFDSLEVALAWLERPSFDLSGGAVVKADGLAAGKGVIVCNNALETKAAVQDMFSGAFGPAGSTVLIEQRLSGREVSVLAFCDGRTVVPMPPARDHKRIFDGDLGPNTGGMGAFCPVLDVEDGFLETVKAVVLEPIVQAMRSRGTPYSGVLYAGLMLTPQGLRVLEFNARFGDPETQAILPLLETDLYDVLEACAAGRLAEVAPRIRWKDGACVAVVVASRGYPAGSQKGVPIHLEPDVTTPSRTVFHAGTIVKDGVLVTNGGRVLNVTAWGQDFDAARTNAYDGLKGVHFDGMQYRQDIGLTVFKAE